jgi:hypothetical protein
MKAAGKLSQQQLPVLGLLGLVMPFLAYIPLCTAAESLALWQHLLVTCPCLLSLHVACFVLGGAGCLCVLHVLCWAVLVAGGPPIADTAAAAGHPG